MIKLLFVDTETTGLVNIRTPYTEETLRTQWPHITQIAWAVVEFDDNLQSYNVIREESHLIKPEYPITDYDLGAVNLTGITYTSLEQSGKDLRETIQKFISDLTSVDAVVAHNAVFDMKMIKAEVMRLGIEQHMRVCPWIDTCYYGMFLCDTRMPNGRRKFPKLDEFYEKATGEKITDAHTADGDVRTLIKAFAGLCKVPAPEVPVMTPDRYRAILGKFLENNQ